MSYYLNEFENNKDYLERGPKAKALTDFNGIPVLAYKNVSDPIQTHMRMMYGHMDWEDYVMKLDEHTLKLIQERDEALVYCTEVVNRLAVMEDEMSYDDRFSNYRHNKVWRETFASMLWQAGQKLSAKAVEMVKICYWTSFNLSESEVEGYMSSLEDE